MSRLDLDTVPWPRAKRGRAG